MKYRSKPTEVEAFQWQPKDPAHKAQMAEAIVAWVNANGGEAKYQNDPGSVDADLMPRIAVHTINGWAYAAPGHYVIKGAARFQVGGFMEPARFLIDFYPCDPETFERRWEVAS